MSNKRQLSYKIEIQLETDNVPALNEWVETVTEVLHDSLKMTNAHGYTQNETIRHEHRFRKPGQSFPALPEPPKKTGMQWVSAETLRRIDETYTNTKEAFQTDLFKDDEHMRGIFNGMEELMSIWENRRPFYKLPNGETKAGDLPN